MLKVNVAPGIRGLDLVRVALPWLYLPPRWEQGFVLILLTVGAYNGTVFLYNSLGELGTCVNIFQSLFFFSFPPSPSLLLPTLSCSCIGLSFSLLYLGLCLILHRSEVFSIIKVHRQLRLIILFVSVLSSVLNTFWYGLPLRIQSVKN